MNTRKQWLFALAWMLGNLLVLAGALPLLVPFFRETLALPFIMADMFLGLSLGLSLGLWQWLLVRMLYRHRLLDWVSMSAWGGALGALLGGFGTVFLQSLSQYAFPAAVPVALIVWTMGLLPWLTLGTQRPAPRTYLAALAGLGMAAATSAWALVGVLSLITALTLGTPLQMRKHKRIAPTTAATASEDAPLRRAHERLRAAAAGHTTTSPHQAQDEGALNAHSAP